MTMNDSATRYPLSWPTGWHRTTPSSAGGPRAGCTGLSTRAPAGRLLDADWNPLGDAVPTIQAAQATAERIAAQRERRSA